VRLCPHCESRYDDTIVSCPDDGEGTIPVAASLSERLMGETLDGRWKIESLLGEGGMGAVFRGTQLKLDRPVAIKVLQPTVADDERVIARFLREAKVLSTLQHPHVVTILDFGRDEQSGLLFLVMELLVGEPLDRWQQFAGNVTVPRTLSIAEQVVTALAETHALGIIHRDLKPHNIFIQTVANGLHVKVLDFGIAKVQGRAVQTLTQAGSIEGTPHYMAPEQVEGGEIGPQTDFYALGGILYEMLAGEPPFDGDTLMSILMKQCHQAPPPLEARWRLASVRPYPGLVQLTMRLLAKKAKDRAPSAKSLLAELQSLKESYVEEVTGADVVFGQTLAPGQRFEEASTTPTNLQSPSPITASGEMGALVDDGTDDHRVAQVGLDEVEDTSDRSETSRPTEVRRATVSEDLHSDTFPAGRVGPSSRSLLYFSLGVLVVGAVLAFALRSPVEPPTVSETPALSKPEQLERREIKVEQKAAKFERRNAPIPAPDEGQLSADGDDTALLEVPTLPADPPVATTVEVKPVAKETPKKKDRRLPKVKTETSDPPSDDGLDAELKRMGR